MNYSCLDKVDVVAFVEGLLERSKPDLQWTMTITPERLEGCFAIFVTGMSSDGTAIQKYSEMLRGT